MRVILVHNKYIRPGGEDVVFEQEMNLLRSNGIEVESYVVENASIVGPVQKFIAALSIFFSIRTYRRFRKVLIEKKPDIVHVHNQFPLISPSVFFACKSLGVPVVATLHNYRLICPTALLMVDGVPTLRSISQGPWWAIPHKVYRDSVVGTFFLAASIWFHRKVGTWQTKVDKFIVLTEFAKEIFVKAGFPVDKLEVKPNFCCEPLLAEEGEASCRDGFLFVGRLSEEKGIATLIDAWRLVKESAGADGESIVIAGDGPLLDNVVAMFGAKAIGAVSSARVRQEMRTARALIVPSTCFEGFPMVIVESLSCGLPIIASRLGAMAEVVQDGVTGLLFNPADPKDLAEKIIWATSHPSEMKEMGRAAQSVFFQRYSAAKNFEMLIDIYRRVQG